MEEGEDLEGEEEESVKILRGKQSAARSGNNVPQKRVKPAADSDEDDNFDGEKAEEKTSVSKFICNIPTKTAQK